MYQLREYSRLFYDSVPTVKTLYESRFYFLVWLRKFWIELWIDPACSEIYYRVKKV